MRFLFLALVATLAAGALADEPPRDSNRQIARELWDRALRITGGKVVEQPHYPTEPALPWLSAWCVTRDPRYVVVAKKQLEYAHSREKKGLVVAPEGVTRDYQARQIYNFYLAYRILGDGTYLQWADGCAKAMIELIPRADHEVGGEKFTLFSAGYVNLEKGGAGSLGYFVDANQNAEVGLAYGLLYHDPASGFFRNPLAKDIAINETLASMAVQDMRTGAIAIGEGEWIEKFDTAYGSYAAMSWVWSQLLWRDERMDEHVRAAGKWLSTKLDLDNSGDHWWPNRSTGAMKDWEAVYRIPVLWYCDIKAESFIDQVFDQMNKHPKTWRTPWTTAFYDLMGIPREYYFGK